MRTLDHDHHIGLLLPTRVGGNGYRFYSPDDLVRLQQILLVRELEFPLDRIPQLLERPGLDEIAAYRDYRRPLVARPRQPDRLIATLDSEPVQEGDRDMTSSDTPIYGRFTADAMAVLRAEAKERWGDTESYRQSEVLTRGMDATDFQRINAEMGTIIRDLVAVMPEGVSALAVQTQIAAYRAGHAPGCALMGSWMEDAWRPPVWTTCRP